jgi:hypothetical protein
LLNYWGEGASLLRGRWQSRDTGDDNQGDTGSPFASSSQPPSSQNPVPEGHDADADIASEGEASFAPDYASPVAAERQAPRDMMSEGDSHADANGDQNGDVEVEMLARDVSALRLVPSSVRFGRGGPTSRGRAGLATRSGRPAARHVGNPQHPGHHAVISNTGNGRDQGRPSGESDTMEQSVAVTPDMPLPARGRHGRGRAGGDNRGSAGAGRGTGRGRGFIPPPPRGGFLLRGAGRGLPGLIPVTTRARVRDTVI